MKFGGSTAVVLAVLAQTACASWGISGASSGIDSSTGARPFRLPISELQQSGPMWDLYILTMQFWQSIDQSSMFSWYGVAGIHGLPQQPWDDATGAGYYVGYCEHSSVLFPTWHRPYMALYEQIVSIYAHEIAATYPQDKLDEYTKAADQLRMPYWDWTTDATIPDIMNQQQVTINTQYGAQTITNPLYRYNFHPYNSSDLDGIYSSVNWTVRQPDSNTVSQPSAANQQLQANQQQFHDGMYQLFSSQSNYSLFSNTGANGNAGGYQNIENLHNIVHDTVGGTMAFLWVAAFDPIFFLHHANVDRLFSIWQAIYPDAYVTPQANALGTYTNPAGGIEDINTPLKPFAADNNGNYYTSNNVRNIKDFGYAYREIVDWNVTKEELTANAKKAVNQIYNPNGGIAAKRSVSSKRDSPEITMKSATAAAQQYVLNLVVDKTKINGTMLVHFALNNASIGSFPINMGSTAANPAKGFAQAAPQAGQIALTHALLNAGANLADVNGTLSSIANGMTWNGTYATGEVVDPAHLKDGAIKIAIAQRQVQQTAPDDEFPNYGNWNQLAESTLGQFASLVLGKAEQAIGNVTSPIEGILRKKV